MQNGDYVEAMTLPSLEYDREATVVRGTLSMEHVPVLGYVKCKVDGVPVDPASVKLCSQD